MRVASVGRALQRTSVRHASTANLKKTPLAGINAELKAKVGDFCGWEMAFSYPDLSSVDSHHHTRNKASLFDVSHMLRLRIDGKDSVEFLEKIFVADIVNLKEGRASYTLLMNEQGGITDDAIISKLPGYYYLVLNAGCAAKDLEHIGRYLKEFKAQGKEVNINEYEGALVAVQGPKAEAVLKSLSSTPEAFDKLYFLDTVESLPISGTDCRVSRCGYTGEDGFEIEITKNIEQVVKDILSHPDAAPAGLVARDTLRLESGLALYGNDILDDISPLEATLGWCITKRRRTDPSFLGGERFAKELQEGVSRKRIGVAAKPGQRIARPGVKLHVDGQEVGHVCSGGFSPVLGHPIGMAYVKSEFAGLDQSFDAKIGSSTVQMVSSKMPFVPTNYKNVPKKKKE